jgi:hypothetical protein
MYAIWSKAASSWISFRGKVLTHDNKGEMEFLFPGSSIRPIMWVAPDDMLSIKDHPDCATYRWPLRKEDFW